MPAAAMELIVQAEPGSFRTAHNVIAEEVIRQMLSADPKAGNDGWKQQLSHWAIDFVRLLRGDWQMPVSNSLIWLRGVFVAA